MSMGRAWLVWGAGATLLILLAATALVALNRLDELPLPEREAAAAPASPGLIAQGEYLVGPAKFTATSNPAIHSGFCAPAWP